MHILGVSCFYHDSAACLLRDDEVLSAVEEERFTRKKHDPAFPINAIEFCLSSGGIVADEVDAVCFYEYPLTKLSRLVDQHIANFPRSFKNFKRFAPRWFGEILPLARVFEERLHLTAPLFYYPHHLSHAACSFFSSPFDEAAILVIDATGENSTTSWGRGSGATVELAQEIPYPHSVGMLYTTITSLLGFMAMEGEGTIMGLAAYGEPTYLDGLNRIARTFDDGSLILDPSYFAFDRKDRMMSRKMERFFFPARDRSEPLEQKHRDMAASIQAFLEDRLLKMAAHVRSKTGCEDLCLGGGVALNSAANGRLEEEGIFSRIFVPPAPGDSGCALGAALLHAHSEGGVRCVSIPAHSSLGSVFSSHEIENFLRLKEIPHESGDEETLCATVSGALAEGKIVGWFQGRMEFGPRALGSRSILATPADAEMKDIVNARVKGREEFRPFGASVLEEEAGGYFVGAAASPFMQKVFHVRPEQKDRIPAVVHEDGTCRIHTVSEGTRNRYRRLLQSFHQKAGVPLLLNTSFNRKGEPIVANPREAYECFASSGIDLLVLGDHLITEKVSI